MDNLILPGAFLLTALVFLITGYVFGRKTKTDMPFITPTVKDNSEEDLGELHDCLYGVKE